MLAPPEKVGSLYLPPTVGGNLRPDVGYVVSAPFSIRTKGRTVTSPKPGTLVCVVPEDGVWLEGAEGFGENQVRCYGHFCEFEGEPQRCDWWNSILCGFEMGELQAYGDKAILKRDSLQNISDGGILLPDRAKTRAAMATVVSAGPLCDGLKDGDRVCYDPRAVEFTFAMDEEREDLAIVSLAGINYVTE